MNVNVMNLILSVLDRKPVIDKEEREKFKEVIYDYLGDLSTLETIYVDSNSSAYNHKSYLDKLIVLSKRWQSIGNEAIPTDGVESFLNKLQDNMSDYLYKNLQSDFYKIRKTHYTGLAFGNNNNNGGLRPSSGVERLKAEMMENLSKPKSDYSNLG
jgi:hypothetical protein